MAPFVLRYKKIDGPSRVAIIISTKIDKRATRRNRMRRIIRESLRHIAPTGAGGAFIVKQNFAQYRQKDVEQLVKTLLHEAGHS